MADNKMQADLQALYRIFTVPEQPDSTLGRIDREITVGVADFLKKHIVTIEKSLEEIEQDFSESAIPESPVIVSHYTEFLEKKLVAHSVHTAAPSFIGHMTTALPYFMLPLSRLMTALNQNLVKVETSKAFTPLERQVLAMLHRLIYSKKENFYKRYIHNSNHALGAFCSGGTVANITALWVARNHLLRPQKGFGGVAKEGLAGAMQFLDCAGLAVLVSRRAHHSLAKAADLLGIGQDNLIALPTDCNNRIKLKSLQAHLKQLLKKRIKPLAIVGIAGTTETGSIDPLKEIAAVTKEYACHFHVDAAWGGPTLFSEKHRHLLAGIELADSVTIDAHKQLYVPMGVGMVLFKDPRSMDSIKHHANYILRRGSKDLGCHTLEGSRPGRAMLVHAGLSIIGKKGYELLIDRGIEHAKIFAKMIEAHPDFELITAPELNILTYRFNPKAIRQDLAQAAKEKQKEINKKLDAINQQIQKQQREAGKSFVSRTRIQAAQYHDQEITVFRVVLANPLSTEEIFSVVFQEQWEIAETMIKTLSS